MAIIRNSFEQFVNHIKSDAHIKSMKIYVVLEANFEEFYYVCEKFADIGLNAPKYRIPGTCDVQGNFQFEDIRKAKEAAKSFYDEKNITDVDEYMTAIEKVYTLAVDFNDTRCQGGMVKPENVDFSNGMFGKYYNFTRIPNDIWGDIVNETKQYIINP